MPIVYGMPDLGLAAQAERGEIELGGCTITGDDPGWHCRACDASFDPARPGR